MEINQIHEQKRILPVPKDFIRAQYTLLYNVDKIAHGYRIRKS